MNTVLSKFGWGISITLVASLVTFALLSERSPFYQDLLEQSPLRIGWMLVNTPAVLISAVTESIILTVIIFTLQWASIGLLLRWIFLKVGTRRI